LDIPAEALQWLARPEVNQSLSGIRRGLEKEALRISADGKLSRQPHPESLGSALTHPNITTDFSEALLEFITPPCESIDEALGWLEDIHTFTFRQLAQMDESLWCASMPCILEGDELIPVGEYGSSHIGRMKKIYRLGLGHRYGRVMQTISGIHYNFSLPDSFWEKLKQAEGDAGDLQDFKTRRYFDLIRNFRRLFWLLLYLFGAAPAVCLTFLKQRTHELQLMGEHSYHMPCATSLRMGNLGYQSEAQESLVVDYNSLPGYIDSLLQGLKTEVDEYKKIGVTETGEDGSLRYKQLNANLLQIENEFYSTIRPKRVGDSGETPIMALHRGGVEYIEVRSLDVNPYHPLGIDACQARFLEVFLLGCLLSSSPDSDISEHNNLLENQHRVVNEGRDPEIDIAYLGDRVNLREGGRSVLEALVPVAEALDVMAGGEAYRQCLSAQQQKIEDAALTPSGKMLAQMEREDVSFFRLANNLSEMHQRHYIERELSQQRIDYFAKACKDSIQKQARIERDDTGTFEEYLERYFSQYDQAAS
jgi:glutamate--cysteine ligase